MAVLVAWTCGDAISRVTALKNAKGDLRTRLYVGSVGSESTAIGHSGETIICGAQPPSDLSNGPHYLPACQADFAGWLLTTRVSRADATPPDLGPFCAERLFIIASNSAK